MEMTRVKKMAVFHDLSGYGRCSLTVALPVISAMGVQGCPVPTAILSNHLGFSEWYMKDFTEEMPSYIQKWKQLSLEFDGILIGYLGSFSQMDIVADFVLSFRQAGTMVYLDPVMGDHGRLYSSCTREFCEKMKDMVALSDMIFPNLTEACLLTDTIYQPDFSKRQVEQIAQTLLRMGPSACVITGIEDGAYLYNLVCERNSTMQWIKKKKAGQNRPGTGDLFSAVVASGNLTNRKVFENVSLAAEFISRSVRRSEYLQIPIQEGVCFEPELSFLLP